MRVYYAYKYDDSAVELLLPVAIGFTLSIDGTVVKSTY